MQKEPILESIARRIRFAKTINIIRGAKKPITIVDLGCGPQAPFYEYLINQEVKINKYIGIDPLIDKKNNYRNQQKVSLIKKPINQKIPLESNSADFVVAHAVLEHLDKPGETIKEMIRITKNGGETIITTPTPISKKILEFLAFRLGLISAREIKEHKNYFDKKKLLELLRKIEFVKIKHEYFELGLNNLLVIKKQT